MEDKKEFYNISELLYLSLKNLTDEERDIFYYFISKSKLLNRIIYKKLDKAVNKVRFKEVSNNGNSSMW